MRHGRRARPYGKKIDRDVLGPREAAHGTKVGKSQRSHRAEYKVEKICRRHKKERKSPSSAGGNTTTYISGYSTLVENRPLDWASSPERV